MFLKRVKGEIRKQSYTTNMTLLWCMQEPPAWDSSAKGHRRGVADGSGGSGRGPALQQRESLLELKQRVMARLQQVPPSLYRDRYIFKLHIYIYMCACVYMYLLATCNSRALLAK